jgi:hypothetical protein
MADATSIEKIRKDLVDNGFYDDPCVYRPQGKRINQTFYLMRALDQIGEAYQRMVHCQRVVERERYENPLDYWGERRTQAARQMNQAQTELYALLAALERDELYAALDAYSALGGNRD